MYGSVRLKYVSGCGKSTIRVWRKYAGSKACKYGKKTVKVQSGTVKVQYRTETFFWLLLYIHYITLTLVSVITI